MTVDLNDDILVVRKSLEVVNFGIVFFGCGREWNDFSAWDPSFGGNDPEGRSRTGMWKIDSY